MTGASKVTESGKPQNEAPATSAVARIEQGLAALGDRFRQAFAAAPSEPALRAEQAKLLGKKGDLTAVLGLLREVRSLVRSLSFMVTAGAATAGATTGATGALVAPVISGRSAAALGVPNPAGMS